MPTTITKLVQAATEEWEHWGKSVWNVAKRTKKIVHRDDDDSFAQYVLDTYCVVAGRPPTLDDIQDDRYAWSAVGMSAFMKKAGLLRAEFPFAESHSRYIRHFVRARKSADKKALYWAYRHGEAKAEPALGDLVAYSRENGRDPAKLYDSTSPYKSHTDLVVAVRPGEVDVIGANVLDSVTKKTLRLDAQGHIDDATHPWFAVLKQRLG